MAKSWSYLQEMMADYEAGACAPEVVALYVVGKVLAQDEVSLPEFPDWLSSQLRQLISRADEGLPIETVSSVGLVDHAEAVREFSVLLKAKGISI